MKQSLKGLARLGSTAVLTSLFVAVNSWAQGPVTVGAASKTEGTSAAAQGVARVDVSFKLDPRLAGGSYGGERWVSPPTFTGAAAQSTVEVKADGSDAKGRPVRISPTWTAADPEMVQISPSQGNAVSIKVTRPGTTTVALAAPGVTKELAVKAELRGKVLQVEISQ